MKRKTLLMLLLMLVGFGFIHVGAYVYFLGFLVTVGFWILVGLLYYDHKQAKEEWEQQHTQR